MARDKQKTLQQRKLELEAELVAIQDELDDSVDQVKKDVSTKLDPIEYVKRHPLPVLAGSVLIGYLVGKDNNDDHENELLSTLWYEIKRMGVRKGIGMISDHADRLINEAVK